MEKPNIKFKGLSINEELDFKPSVIKYEVAIDSRIDNFRLRIARNEHRYMPGYIININLESYINIPEYKDRCLTTLYSMDIDQNELKIEEIELAKMMYTWWEYTEHIVQQNIDFFNKKAEELINLVYVILDITTDYDKVRRLLNIVTTDIHNGEIKCRGIVPFKYANNPRQIIDISDLNKIKDTIKDELVELEKTERKEAIDFNNKIDDKYEKGKLNATTYDSSKYPFKVNLVKSRRIVNSIFIKTSNISDIDSRLESFSIIVSCYERDYRNTLAFSARLNTPIPRILNIHFIKLDMQEFNNSTAKLDTYKALYDSIDLACNIDYIEGLLDENMDILSEIATQVLALIINILDKYDDNVEQNFDAMTLDVNKLERDIENCKIIIKGIKPSRL
jgi:hypothetical protein